MHKSIDSNDEFDKFFDSIGLETWIDPLKKSGVSTLKFLYVNFHDIFDDDNDNAELNVLKQNRLHVKIVYKRLKDRFKSIKNDDVNDDDDGGGNGDDECQLITPPPPPKRKPQQSRSQPLFSKLIQNNFSKSKSLMLMDENGITPVKLIKNPLKASKVQTIKLVWPTKNNNNVDVPRMRIVSSSTPTTMTTPTTTSASTKAATATTTTSTCPSTTEESTSPSAATTTTAATPTAESTAPSTTTTTTMTSTSTTTPLTSKTVFQASILFENSIDGIYYKEELIDKSDGTIEEFIRIYAPKPENPLEKKFLEDWNQYGQIRYFDISTYEPKIPEEVLNFLEKMRQDDPQRWPQTVATKEFEQMKEAMCVALFNDLQHYFLWRMPIRFLHCVCDRLIQMYPMLDDGSVTKTETIKKRILDKYMHFRRYKIAPDWVEHRYLMLKKDIDKRELCNGIKKRGRIILPKNPPTSSLPAAKIFKANNENQNNDDSIVNDDASMSSPIKQPKTTTTPMITTITADQIICTPTINNNEVTDHNSYTENDNNALTTTHNEYDSSDDQQLQIDADALERIIKKEQ